MDAVPLLRRDRVRRLANLGLLIVAFALGQGSIFLAQSWLVGTGQLEALAQFGIAFSFATLASQLVDAGAMILLARRAAQFTAGAASRTQLERAYWSHSYVRLGLALAASATAAGLLLASADRHAWGYLAGAWPGLVMWSFNGSGLLDGLNRGGLSGLTGALPYFTSAVALPLSAGWSEAGAGLMQGIAFSGGYLVAVVVQLLALRRLGWRLRPVRPTGSDLGIALGEGAAMLVGMLAGQLFFRVQLLISTSVLGKGPTAIFIYAYQAISAVVQVIGFTRRVEFPALVSRFTSVRPGVRTIFAQQKVGTVLSLLGTVFFLAVGVGGAGSVPPEWRPAAELLAPLSFIIAASGLTFALSQGAHASGRHGWVAAANNVGVVAGTVVTIALVQNLQLAGLALGNLACVCVIGCVLFALIISEPGRA